MMNMNDITDSLTKIEKAKTEKKSHQTRLDTLQAQVEKDEVNIKVQLGILFTKLCEMKGVTPEMLCDVVSKMDLTRFKKVVSQEEKPSSAEKKESGTNE